MMRNSRWRSMSAAMSSRVGSGPGSGHRCPRALPSASSPAPPPTPSGVPSERSQPSRRLGSLRSTSTYVDGSSTICAKITARAAASGRRAHHRCSVLGMAVADRLLPRRGLVDRLERQRDLDELLLRPDGLVIRGVACDARQQLGEVVVHARSRRSRARARTAGAGSARGASSPSRNSTIARMKSSGLLSE